MSGIIPFLYYDRKINNEYLRDTLDPFNIFDRCFIDNYRMPKQLVYTLISDIRPFIDESENTMRVPLHLEVLATLNFYANGSHQRRVGLDAFAVMSQSKISYCISKISKVIGTQLIHDHIRFPTSLIAANVNKNAFYMKYGVPGIVGLIDCTHIAIAIINKKDEYAYVNRKGFHSINTQMICDANLRIIALNARYPGSTHDSHIWDGCVILPVLKRLNTEDNKTWLFGDSGYALKPYMMVPIRRPSTQKEQNFNVVHSKIRSVVERCFGILKSRFRCLKRASGHLHYSHERTANIIASCAVLHNILLDNNYPIDDYVVEDDIIPINNALEEENSGDINRQFLTNYIEERGIII